MKIRILSSHDVKKSLPMKAAIEVTKRAFSSLSSRKVEMPLRSRINIPKQDGILLTMPAALIEDDQIAVKIVSVFGKNVNRGLPLIHGIVIVLDAVNGKILSLMDLVMLLHYKLHFLHLTNHFHLLQILKIY